MATTNNKYSLIGWLVVSLTGHDQTRFYIVVDEDDKRLHLADGIYRPLGRTKCKNYRHIRPIQSLLTKQEVDELRDMHPGSGLADKIIRDRIKAGKEEYAERRIN